MLSSSAVASANAVSSDASSLVMVAMDFFRRFTSFSNARTSMMKSIEEPREWCRVVLLSRERRLALGTAARPKTQNWNSGSVSPMPRGSRVL